MMELFESGQAKRRTNKWPPTKYETASSCYDDTLNLICDHNQWSDFQTSDRLGGERTGRTLPSGELHRSSNSESVVPLDFRNRYNVELRCWRGQSGECWRRSSGRASGPRAGLCGRALRSAFEFKVLPNESLLQVEPIGSRLQIRSDRQTVQTKNGSGV